ncbi:MAG: phosphoenolpyruvate kinase [Balneolaceae bacterium]
MKQILTDEKLRPVLDKITKTNNAFSEKYPGESSARQAIHTVYGGAQIFKAETSQRLGELALRSLNEYTSDFVTFAKVLEFPGHEQLSAGDEFISDINGQMEMNPEKVQDKNEAAWLAHTVYERVVQKLKKEPVEDFRIDFEDGYGNRPNREEDSDAVRTAKETARGMRENKLPPFIGIRIKPLTAELRERSLRTLDIYLSTLLDETGGKLPNNFVVTLPKVVSTGEISAIVDTFELIEAGSELASGSLKLELMIETPQSIINQDGEIFLPKFIPAARGRCVSAHFGVYDYTASVNITAAHQEMDHAACDFARHMMKVSFAQTGINISDGATNIMPVGPHRAAKGETLTKEQQRENREVVHRAWKIMFGHVNHSLRQGYYQGWDLHPAQFPVRYAAVYLFFLQSLAGASNRLKTFVERAAQATLVGDVFDDAATGQGLLNYFLRGINCGAITLDEARATGLTLDEIRGRSFIKILENRKNKS